MRLYFKAFWEALECVLVCEKVNIITYDSIYIF